MIAFALDSPKQVDELYSKAIELGAINEGDPGPRHGENYYGYFRDLDGNKLAFFTDKEPEDRSLPRDT